MFRSCRRKTNAQIPSAANRAPRANSSSGVASDGLALACVAAAYSRWVTPTAWHIDDHTAAKAPVATGRTAATLRVQLIAHICRDDAHSDQCAATVLIGAHSDLVRARLGLNHEHFRYRSCLLYT